MLFCHKFNVVSTLPYVNQNNLSHQNINDHSIILLVKGEKHDILSHNKSLVLPLS